MRESDERYAQHVAEDCQRLLGSGIWLDRLEIETGPQIVLRVRYRLGEASGISEGRGRTLIAAHADLRRNVVADRIGLGLRELTGR